MTEYTPTDDKIIGRMQLEQEQFANRHGFEIPETAWLPEIYFVRALDRKQIEPRPVRNGDEQTDHNVNFTGSPARGKQ